MLMGFSIWEVDHAQKCKKHEETERINKRRQEKWNKDLQEAEEAQKVEAQARRMEIERQRDELIEVYERKLKIAVRKRRPDKVEKLRRKIAVLQGDGPGALAPLPSPAPSDLDSDLSDFGGNSDSESESWAWVRERSPVRRRWMLGN